MNGYQLIRALEERTDGRWRPSPGAVYPALAQLQDEALVEPADGDGKVFALTETGRAEAEKADDRARPWEAMAGTVQDAEPDSGPRAELWQALSALSQAARAAVQSGDDAVVSAAARLLDESRRGVYRLLADGVDESESSHARGSGEDIEDTDG